MGLRLISPPAEEPVTVDEAKAFLSEVGGATDPLISALLKASRQTLDGWGGKLGRALVTQTWELSLDEFPLYEVRIPLGPVQSILSIKYDDEDGIENTVDPGDYYLDNTSYPAWVALNEDASWPSTLGAFNAVRIQFVCGYGGAADVPEPIRQAIILQTASHFRFRGDAVRREDVPGVGSVEYLMSAVGQDTIETLIGPYRVGGGFS